jgi:hypothetical protein
MAPRFRRTPPPADGGRDPAAKSYVRVARRYPGERRARLERVSLVVVLLAVALAIALVAYRDEPASFVVRQDAVGTIPLPKGDGQSTHATTPTIP